LIADSSGEGTGDLEARLEAAENALAAHGLRVASSSLLDGDEVLQLGFAEGEPAAVLAAIDAHFAPAAALVSSGEIIVPRVFVSDMDSTMIGQECIDELADYAGIKEQIAAITERAMQGELDFEAALRERVTLLEGLEENAISRCLDERIRANPGARVLTRTLAAHGAKTVLVTGGFHHFADVVGAQLGFERVVGNRLDVTGGRLSGGLIGGIVDSGVKRSVLEAEVVEAGQGAHSLATGDGANDIPMIEAASYGFAYRAKPKARAAANGRIESEDLTTVLLLLGIARKDWVQD
jgi:phosphoserine phosphatase